MKERSFTIKDVITDRKDVEIKLVKKDRVFKNTINSNEFFAQYKDPRWQKKRLKIMERDNFKCTSCQTPDKTLNVHHCVTYRKNTKPWEYEDEELITLCEDCHKQLSQYIKDCNQIVLNNCRGIEIGFHFWNILNRLDFLNPWQMQSISNIIKEVTEF